jgi:hypothetical protein
MELVYADRESRPNEEEEPIFSLRFNCNRHRVSLKLALLSRSTSWAQRLCDFSRWSRIALRACSGSRTASADTILRCSAKTAVHVFGLSKSVANCRTKGVSRWSNNPITSRSSTLFASFATIYRSAIVSMISVSKQLNCKRRDYNKQEAG